MTSLNFPRAKARVFVTMAALVTILISVSPSAAADPTVVQVITGGLRTASVADLTLASVSYSHTQQTNTGTMVLTANDLSGTGAGWNVTIQSSAFVYSGSNSGTNIPALNFAVTLANEPTVTVGQAIDLTGGPKVPAADSTGPLNVARKVVQANAGFGLGLYTQNLDVSLTIPAESRAGTYTGTITTTISAAP